MGTYRLQKKLKRRRQVLIQKTFICIVGFIVVLCLSVSLGSTFAIAKDGKAEPSSDRHKYYKSIELKSGDTLWGIAQIYGDENYDSADAYIKEILSINGLTCDEIHEGQYLTIPYYRD